MRIVSLLLTIACCAVCATVVTNPFTGKKYIYNSDKYEIVEGDIRVLKNGGRIGLREPRKLWPNRTIPYKFNQTSFTAKEMNFLNQAIESFHQKTCIKIVPATEEHMLFVWISSDGTGCWSSLGYSVINQQEINLGPGCLDDLATPVHVFLHICGMDHEHNRYDRDKWVKINWKNIEVTLVNQPDNFVEVDPRFYSNYGVPYNYLSVMHYSLTAFSKGDGLKTMETLKPHSGPMGSEIGWADSDVEKLHRMYKCTSRFS